MQTSINKAGQPVGFPGQLSDSMEGVDVVSRFNQEAAAQMPFGIGVKPGTVRDGVKLPAAQADVIEGIVKWGANHMPANAAGTIGDLGATGLLPKAGLEVVRRGRMYVVVDPGIAAGAGAITPYVDRGYCRAVVNGGNNVVGAWTNAADGVNTIDCTKQVQFVSDVRLAADGVTKMAEVEVSFNNKP
jgi:hypothetical protein